MANGNHDGRGKFAGQSQRAATAAALNAQARARPQPRAMTLAEVRGRLAGQLPYRRRSLAEPPAPKDPGDDT